MKTVKRYLEHLKLEGKAANTLETYTYHLATFSKWISTKLIKEDQIKTTDLLEFREHLSLQDKTPRTINAILSCIRGYYDYLILLDIVKTNPVAKALNLKIKSKMIDPLSDEEINQLLSHINSWKENVRAAFHCMIGTGTRVGEIAALKKGDFLIRDGQVWINIVDAKWGSDRKIPIILKESAIIVYEYIKTIDVYEAPAFRVSKRTLQTYADNFQKKTGIPFHCHVIRHTFATKLLESGVDIEKIRFMLGHKTYNMTRHYTQAANINVKELAPTIWQKGEEE